MSSTKNASSAIERKGSAEFFRAIPAICALGSILTYFLSRAGFRFGRDFAFTLDNSHYEIFVGHLQFSALAISLLAAVFYRFKNPVMFVFAIFMLTSAPSILMGMEVTTLVAR